MRFYSLSRLRSLQLSSRALREVSPVMDDILDADAELSPAVDFLGSNVHPIVDVAAASAAMWEAEGETIASLAPTSDQGASTGAPPSRRSPAPRRRRHRRLAPPLISARHSPRRPRPPDFRTYTDLPLARIKRIMKSDDDVRMISAEAPALFCAPPGAARATRRPTCCRPPPQPRLASTLPDPPQPRRASSSFST